MTEEPNLIDINGRVNPRTAASIANLLYYYLLNFLYSNTYLIWRRNKTTRKLYIYYIYYYIAYTVVGELELG